MVRTCCFAFPSLSAVSNFPSTNASLLIVKVSISSRPSQPRTTTRNSNSSSLRGVMSKLGSRGWDQETISESFKHAESERGVGVESERSGLSCPRSKRRGVPTAEHSIYATHFTRETFYGVGKQFCTTKLSPVTNGGLFAASCCVNISTHILMRPRGNWWSFDLPPRWSERFSI